MVERVAARASAATSCDEVWLVLLNDVKIVKVVDKELFKFKKFGRVKLKVVVMGFF